MDAPGYVLVVDDQPDVRRLVLDIVEVVGLTGREAANGEQALQLVRQEQPAVIVLDIMMPVMNGLATIARLQADPNHRKIPVILLSALDDSSHQMAKLPSVIGVLHKGRLPVDDLMSLLKQATGIKYKQ
jgi:CheY-like chemotaxis protein